jgi:hypothetical protein
VLGGGVEAGYSVRETADSEQLDSLAECRGPLACSRWMPVPALGSREKIFVITSGLSAMSLRTTPQARVVVSRVHLRAGLEGQGAAPGGCAAMRCSTAQPRTEASELIAAPVGLVEHKEADLPSAQGSSARTSAIGEDDF